MSYICSGAGFWSLVELFLRYIRIAQYMGRHFGSRLRILFVFIDMRVMTMADWISSTYHKQQWLRGGREGETSFSLEFFTVTIKFGTVYSCPALSAVKTVKWDSLSSPPWVTVAIAIAIKSTCVFLLFLVRAVDLFTKEHIIYAFWTPLCVTVVEAIILRTFL